MKTSWPLLNQEYPNMIFLIINMIRYESYYSVYFIISNLNYQAKTILDNFFRQDSNLIPLFDWTQKKKKKNPLFDNKRFFLVSFKFFYKKILLIELTKTHLKTSLACT